MDIFKHKEGKQEHLDLLTDPLVLELSKKYNVKEGHITLNWELSKDVVVIPSTSNPNRMKQNLESLNFKLSNEDILRLDALNIPYRFNPTSQHKPFEGIDITA